MSSFLVPAVFSYSFFFFNDTATTEIYTLSLHDALPISFCAELILQTPSIWNTTVPDGNPYGYGVTYFQRATRSEEHTSELQSQFHLVCRLLLEKKKKKNT